MLLTQNAAQTIPVSNGVVSVSNDGIVTFKPAANYNGPISFNYTISDGEGGSDTAIVNGTVTPVNDAPIANNDAFTITEDGTTGPLNLLGNDTDPDGDTLAVTSINGTQITPGSAQSIAVNNGTVNISAEGEITFTLNANYNGTISFDYSISDGKGGADSAKVIGNINALNDPPVAVDDSFTIA